MSNPYHLAPHIPIHLKGIVYLWGFACLEGLVFFFLIDTSFFFISTVTPPLLPAIDAIIASYVLVVNELLLNTEMTSSVKASATLGKMKSHIWLDMMACRDSKMREPSAGCGG